MPRPNKFAKAGTAELKNQRFIYRISAQADSPLFKLPLELRSVIWELALPRSVRPRLLHREASDHQEDPPRYIFDHTFPLCRWQAGNMGLLRVCKRINNEATRVFYAANVFDCVVETPEPVLVIAYGDPDGVAAAPEDVEHYRSHESRPAVRLSRVSRAKGQRKLGTIKREYVGLIRGWVLEFPTHLGFDFDEQRDDAMDYLTWAHPELSAMRWGARERQIAETVTAARDAGMRAERKAHRLQVLFGVDRWLQLSGAVHAEQRFGHLELVFYRYFDCEGMLDKPDDMLQRAVLQALPRWLLTQVA